MTKTETNRLTSRIVYLIFFISPPNRKTGVINVLSSGVSNPVKICSSSPSPLPDADVPEGSCGEPSQAL